MSRHAAIAILCLAAMPPTGASAVDFKHREPFVPTHECTCRFKGENLPLGARRCLMTAQGPRISECVTELNVTSWRPSYEECPQALVVTPRG
ncbi:MAG TPA: hypothetical protein VH414_11730 [Lichenihabitans sp.]|jgi:hypothetical protein|nr:hypothetical protein [Lichenihabitans sp.]